MCERSLESAAAASITSSIDETNQLELVLHLLISEDLYRLHYQLHLADAAVSLAGHNPAPSLNE